MKTKILLASLILLLAFTTCTKKDEFQFTLYSEYIDSDVNCKTIKVSIDGEEKVNDQICYTGILPTVTTSSFQISSGKNKLRAEIVEGSKVFEQFFEFEEDKKFGYLMYNNKTSEFNFFTSTSGGIMK
jgi:hypothetical protein